MASNENGDGNNGQLGYKGYQWEPEYTEEELAEIHSGSQDRNSVHARSTDLSWCTCNLCTPMRQLRESTCCQEFEHYTADYLTDTISCITLHEDFALICLNPLVLETAYVTFLRYKRQSGRAPDVLSSRQYRLMAYRQFINWVRRGQLLGKRFRVVIPACVVLKIRKTFPEPSGEYEGYHSASSSDSDLD